MKKKVMSLLLVFVMLLSLMPAAFAATNDLAVLVEADKTSVGPGEELTISVKIAENPGVASFKIALDIGTGVFEFVSMAVDSAWSSASVNETDISATYSGANNVTNTGTVFTAKLKVLESVSVSDAVLSVNVTNVWDKDLNNVSTSVENATITVGSAASTDPYTAELGISNNEVKVGDTVSVDVVVGGTTGTFASSELTLAYDTRYLTFVKDTSTLNGAEVTDSNGTIKLVDRGAAQSNGTAYTLVFTAAAATSDSTATVALSSAAFSTAENAISADLTAATGTNALNINVKNADLKVDLGNDLKGDETVEYGEDYTFSVADSYSSTYTYYDWTVDATMSGQTVTPTDNGNGTWTISNVTGNLEISVTKTAKTYDVTISGDDYSRVTTTGVTDGKATYGQDVTFTLPAAKEATETGDGYHYTATVKIGSADYTPTNTSGTTYKIDGTAITGAVQIVVTKETDAANSVVVTIQNSNEIQKDGTAVTEFAATKNGDVTLTLVPETGYNYVITVDGTKVDWDENTTTYTLSVGESAVTIAVTKTVDTSSVAFQQYIQLNGTTMWLVTINGNGTGEISGKTYTYGGENMYWSSKYQAYCYLVVAETLDTDTAKAAIGDTLVSGTATSVDYDMDVNNTGKVDANDAQLAYDMYQTKAYSGFDSVAMLKFLEADVNGSKAVDTADAAEIVTAILNGTANSTT